MLRPDVLDGLMETARDLGGGGGLEFESEPSLAFFKHEIEFDTGCRAVVARLPSGISLENLLKREAERGREPVGPRPE